MSKRLWNVDRVLDEYWNNDENVNVLKWPIWGVYIMVLWWILNRIWDADWAIMNLGCWWMVLWVLRRIYYCIFIECNCDEWFVWVWPRIYHYIILNVIVTNVLRKIYHCIILNVNYHEQLYEYYEGSIVVLYWTLIIMNGWMSNTKGIIMLYWMLNCYGMFVCVLQRIYYRVTEC